MKVDCEHVCETCSPQPAFSEQLLSSGTEIIQGKREIAFPLCGKRRRASTKHTRHSDFFKYRKQAMQRLPKAKHPKGEGQIPGSRRETLLKA